MNINIGPGINGFKVRRQKFGVLSLIFLILFGAAFTAIGLFAVSNSKIDQSWTRVSGKVTETSSSISSGSTTYTPVVNYQAGGQSYRVTSSTGSSFYPQVGSIREVAYNPDHPNQAKVVEGSGMKSLLLVFPAVGIFIVVIAPILFIMSLRRSSKINKLVSSGQKIEGVLVDIQATGGSNNNSNNSYKIVVSAPNTSGGVQNYTSDSLSGVAGLAMADFRNNPIPIDVYIDPSNSQNYYVDISDIPNLSAERIGQLIKSAVDSQQTHTIAQTDQSVPPVPPTVPINK